MDVFFSRRRRFPNEELHLMDPRGLWDLWDYLSLHSPLPIPPNPPSSGFIGTVIINQLDKEVTFLNCAAIFFFFRRSCFDVVLL